MTKQIEQAYRRNRGRSWLLIAAIVALAAVAIPIASGGGGKYYTLGSNKSVCVGDTGVAVPLTLTNAAGSQSLGSANITFPAYVSVTGTTRGTLEGNVVKLRDLNLAMNASLNVTVTVTVNAVGASTIGAVVKQANNFSGSGGSNLFELKPQASLPVLTATNCFGTISGQIWNDQNENRVRDAAFEAAQNTWTVRLYKKGTSVYPSTPFRESSPTTFDSDGVYTFADVPLGSDYLVCIAPPASDLRSWHQTTDTNNATCETLNASNETNGIEIAAFAVNAPGTDIGNAWSTVVATCGGSATSNLDFSVAGGSGSNCKATGPTEAEFVYEKWTEGGVQFAAFHPVDGDGVCDLAQTAEGTCTYFVQKMTWVFTASEQPDPGNRSLNYDDKKNADGKYEYEAMKYCKMDPRASESELGLAADLGTPAEVATKVLPDGTRTVDTGAGGTPLPVEQREPHSSCLIKSTESTTTGGTISRVDLVFTAVDGRSAMG